MNMKNAMKWGCTLQGAVLAALVVPVGANAALQYTPPQAMVLTCNGTAPNVLGKTSVLATFACANGQAPQAVGVTSGLGNMLGLASGAAALVASEAVPHLALPAMGGRSGAGSNGSGSGANGSDNGTSGSGANGSGGTGSNSGSGGGSGNGSNGSGSGANGSGNGTSGSDANGSGNGSAGSTAASGAPVASSGGGWLGHLVHNIGQAAQQVGQQLVGNAFGGSGSASPPAGVVPVSGNGSAVAPAGVLPALGQSSMASLEDGPVVQVYPDGTKVTLIYQRPGGDGNNALAWLKQNDPQGRYPVRIVQAVHAARGGGLDSSGYRTVGGTVAFCESTHSDGGGEEAMTCRVRSNGDLYVRVAGGLSSHEVPDGYGKLGPEYINPTSFTVPLGAFQQAYTNLGGTDTHFYRSESTGSFRATQGFMFSTADLKSIPHMAARIGARSSCPAGVVVHTREGVPVVFQQETSGDMPFGWLPLGSGKNIYATLRSGFAAQKARQQSRIEACEEVADVPAASADLPSSPVLVGVKDTVEVRIGKGWITAPEHMYSTAGGNASPRGVPAYPLNYVGMPRQYAPWADAIAGQTVNALHAQGFGNVSIVAGQYAPD